MFPEIKPTSPSLFEPDPTGSFQVRLSPALSTPPPQSLEEVVAALAGYEGVGQEL